MKCSYCGAPLEKGRVFCLNCGEEIQWVAEYHPISSYRMKREDQEPVPVPDNNHHQQINPRIHEKPKQEMKPKKKKTPVVAGFFTLLLVLAALLGVKGYMDHKNYHSYDYQFSMAETNYSNHEYETALEFADRAIALMPEDEDAYLLKAQILCKQDDADGAETILLGVIEKDSGSVAAYGQLIKFYEDERDYDSLKTLVTGITDDTVKARYQSYLPAEVSASQPPGEYDELITVELYTKTDQECSIYYTLDGSDPMLLQNLYETGIVLEEGTTTIRAAAVNEKHVVGDTESYTYEIELPSPEVPTISPVSGEYDQTTKTSITVEVPEGCTAYYSFDEKPTRESTIYSAPVDMPEGEHTFYVMLVNEYGKESYPGSATYVLKEEIS